jgi:hypothetical protein
MNQSRRQFNRWIGAVVATTACFRPSLGFADSGLNLGLNTWSLRALSQDEALPVIIEVMKQTGLQDCQLLFSHVEPAKFNPVLSSWTSERPQVTSNTATTGRPQEDCGSLDGMAPVGSDELFREHPS